MRHLTIVYSIPNDFDVTGLTKHELISAMSWGHVIDRYKTARKMNPHQWANAWHLNITTGKPFDEIIDEATP